MECVCRTSAAMAGTEYGYVAGILLHSHECYLSGDMDAGFGRTGSFLCCI